MLLARGARGQAAAGFLRPEGDAGRRRRRGATAGGARHDGRALAPPGRVRARAGRRAVWRGERESTRLNSSHTVISYAVFCLKKKKAIRGNHLLRRMIEATSTID